MHWKRKTTLKETGTKGAMYRVCKPKRTRHNVKKSNALLARKTKELFTEKKKISCTAVIITIYLKLGFNLFPKILYTDLVWYHKLGAINGQSKFTISSVHCIFFEWKKGKRSREIEWEERAGGRAKKGVRVVGELELVKGWGNYR